MGKPVKKNNGSPGGLFASAKKRTAESRKPFRELTETGLKSQLAGASERTAIRRPGIRWVTVDGGVPAGLDLSNRSAMHEWLRRTHL